MKFSFSRDFMIDTSEEPWRSEGLRTGVYANPGAGKSYTVALLVEQWLDQGGTVVVFEPRAEWHTLRQHYPIQVVGGPFLQDVPLVASESALYARVVVEQGVSLVFYTGDIEDEEKLVEFTTKFIQQVLRLQEKHHRPLLLVVEEAQEFSPRSAQGHIAPPWVYSRMTKAFKDCFTQGRKLNICPVAISQRPQEVNFTIRQLANLVWFGGFSAQDVGYLDKEVFAHFRKNGVDVKAQDLLGVGRGEWLVIVGKRTHKVKVTEKRKTPHGADTPTLDYVQPVGEEVQRAVSALGEQLKAMLEKRAVEESELEKSKHRVRDLEKEVEDLQGKIKLGRDLRTLLQPQNGTDHLKELEELQSTIKGFKAEADAKGRQVNELSETLKSVKAELNLAQELLKAYTGLDQAVRALVESNIELLLPKHLPNSGESPQPLSDDGKLVVERTLSDMDVVVHREHVTPDESTLRGQLAILMAEGELDKALSMRSIAERLRDLGFSAPGKGLQEELAWYVKNRILEKRSDGYYKVRDKDRIVVREAP